MREYLPWTRPPGLKNALAAKNRRRRPARRLCLERLEPRQLLSASLQPSLPANAAVATLNDEYRFDVVAKAEPDEWFTGIGESYVRIDQPPPSPDAIPKVNQDYVWGMTQAGDDVWFATAANVGTAFGALSQLAGGSVDTSWRVIEGPNSRNPAIPEVLRPYLGDWRAPRIYQHDTSTGQTLDRTPDDPLIQRTLGLRSAGANDDVVLLAGPTLFMLGINVFAFDARTGHYLGSSTLHQYNDVRQWVNVNGQLYTGVLRTTSLNGEGAVIRWTGTRSRPFRFEEVGWLDLEGAYIAEHEGRLYVSTWPLYMMTVQFTLGGRSEATPGIWMSPPLGAKGLSRKNAGQWKKVWNISEYEVDPVIAQSYGGGALHSFDGYLYWGTLNTPGTNALFLETYPEAGIDLLDFTSPAMREATLFRGKHLDDPSRREVELLFGDDQLWKYTRLPDGSGQWGLLPNRTGVPLFGQAGYRAGPFQSDRGSPKTRLYTYTMAVVEDRLYVGTEDFAMAIFGGEFYVAAGGDLDLANALMAADPPAGPGFAEVSLGADLLVFFPDDAGGNAVPPALVDEHGLGNPLNFGVRTMIATPRGLFAGTSNASNLLTAPYDPPTQPLKTGGCELIRVDLSDRNDAPLAIHLSAQNVPEHASDGAVIGLLSAADRDPRDTHDFALLDDADGRFQIAGHNLVVGDGSRLDYQADTSHTIRLQATDSGGQTYDEEFVIYVTPRITLAAMDVQRGAAQRSYLRYVDLVFASDLGLADLAGGGRVRLMRFGLNGSSGTSVSLHNVLQVDGDRLILDFGPQGIGGNASSTSGDGYYQIGLDLDGNGSFETTRSFYRLLGDVNGDRTVNSRDLDMIRAAYGQSGSGLQTDVNASGTVDRADWSAAYRNRGKRLGTQLQVDD